MNDDQLINKNFHTFQRNKIIKDKDRFIYREISNRINLSLENINLTVTDCLEIGFSSNSTYSYISSRFKKINYAVLDISKKNLERDNLEKKLICHDHDKWILKENEFDLIISNFYLHLTNDFDLLLSNINSSLKKNGFFIAAIPSINCFHEIKDCMIQADLEMYEGAYRRFKELLNVEKISQILKKNNYKIPVIEIDTIELRYKEFNKLLNDIRYLGNSYVYKDRKKKFEHKNYFKTVEDIYWKKYSNKNQLILSLEIIIITGWKEDPSQQIPLKPGEAKISLKDFLQ